MLGNLFAGLNALAAGLGQSGRLIAYQNDAQRQALEFQAYMYQQQQSALAPVATPPGAFLMTDGECMRWEALPEPAHQGRCVSCGSSEFVSHRGQTICTYCRGAA